MLALEIYPSLSKERLTEADRPTPIDDEPHEVTMTKLRTKLSHVFGPPPSVPLSSSLASVIETDFLNRNGLEVYSDKSTESSSLLPCCPSLSESGHMRQPLLSDVPSVDETEWSQVASILTHKLEQVSRQTRFSRHKILLPCNLIDKVAKDIVRMSCCEPCGVRGLAIFLYLQRNQDGQCLKLGSIDCDQNTVATFELHLTLIEDKKRWFHFKDLVSLLMPGCMSEEGKDDIYMSPGYQLEKKKLYRQNHFQS